MSSAMLAARDEERAIFRRFAAEEISPHAASVDRSEAVSPAIIRELADRGYLGALLPPA